MRRYTIVPKESAHLPYFPGPTVRGAVGAALRKLLCATRKSTCDGCVLQNACAYAMLHDGHTPLDRRSGSGAHAPPPVWIRDIDRGGHMPEGRPFRFSFVAYGPAIRSLPYLDEAVRSAAERGLGRDRTPFDLASAIDEERSDLGALMESRIDRWTSALRGSAGRLWIQLASPVNIRLKGDAWNDPGRPLPSWPERLIGGAARRRIALEKRWIRPSADVSVSVPSALRDAESVELELSSLQRVTLRRFSSTQRRDVELVGAVGDLQLGGSGITSALPWIAAAEVLGVGSGTTFGLGRIRVEA
ncbi:MAG: CRISPR system precrRNA processing endoribonuclease RAMP protein Cas6 [Polyangiaceae bacterium]|nr:CRISPR system precrRNA processing endoribonuclease RAMP protein Cas6 [Polyangiaceae bacterium]